MNISSSFHEIEFKNGKKCHSQTQPMQASWMRNAVKMRVKRGNQYKTVFASYVPIKCLTVHHNGLKHAMNVPEGCQVFQSIVAQSQFDGKNRTDTVLGRIVGIIKNNEVLEEYFLDGVSHNIVGFKYKDHGNISPTCK